jgi:hypothetical protein
MKMTEADLKVESVSEDTSMGEEKFVPVAEAIRYRKRAQAAEKELAEAQRKLGEIETQKTHLAQQLSQTQQEQTLREKLFAAGAADADTALLVVKDRLAGDEKADADKVIEQLRRDKPYLFETLSGATAFSRTRGTKDKSAATQQGLKNAAAKAAQTAGRTELMEYMRTRRKHS